MIKDNKKRNEFSFRTDSLLDLMKVSVKYLFDENFCLKIRIDNSDDRMKIPIVLKVKRNVDYDILEEDETIKLSLRSKRNQWKSKR